jgi:steroid 5-alpha reductase family enzyme
VAIAWLAYVFAVADTQRGLLLTVLTTIWGLRLAGYLAYRNIGHGEDARYQAMRRRHEPRFVFTSLYRVFLLQGVIMWLVAHPVVVGRYGTSPLGVLDALGVCCWFGGLFFEAVGDWQLARFKRRSENRGSVCDLGLWRYTRHPNYFGDFLVWWGLYVIAVAGSGWWTILSPTVMSVLLIRVSGVPLLEQTMRHRPGYQDYVARTSAFFPRRPRDRV